MAKTQKGNMFDREAEIEVRRREEENLETFKAVKTTKAPKSHSLIIGVDEAEFQFANYLRFKYKETNTALLSRALRGYYSADAKMFCEIKPEFQGSLVGVGDAS